MRSHYRAVVAVAALTATLTLTGGAVASAVAARSGQEQFRLTSTVATATREHVQATGVLTTTGHANLGPRSGARQVNWLVFGRGSIRLVTHTTSTSVSVPSPPGCRFTEVHRGTYVINGGRGRFVHAAGRGRFVTRTTATLKLVNGNCTTTIVSFRQVTTTTGSLSW